MRRVAVLTNKPLRHSERMLEGLGFRQLFDDVVGGDGPHPAQADPAGLRALMAGAGADRQRTLMVGDSMVDYETARNAGAACCLVTWGFGYSRMPREDAAGRAVGGGRRRRRSRPSSTSSSFSLWPVACSL